MGNYIFLSHVISPNTPTFGNRNQVEVKKVKSICCGDSANDSWLSTTVHAGTHIDMPCHFYEDGKSINDYDEAFWIYKNPLILEVTAKDHVIENELIEKLSEIPSSENHDILIVKTGICHKREQKEFWEENPGFSPKIHGIIQEKFPKIRVFGFDSISLSSFANRPVGKEAHLEFLQEKHPILPLEDMDLTKITEASKIEEIIIAPLRLENCDGLPCTVLAKLSNAA